MHSSIGSADEMLTHYLVTTRTAGDIFLGKVRYYKGQSEPELEASVVKTEHQLMRYPSERVMLHRSDAVFKVPRMPRANLVSQLPPGGDSTPTRPQQDDDLPSYYEGRSDKDNYSSPGGRGGAVSDPTADGVALLNHTTSDLDNTRGEATTTSGYVSAGDNVLLSESDADAIRRLRDDPTSQHDVDDTRLVSGDERKIQIDRDRKAWLDTQRRTLEFCDFYTRIRDCYMKNQVELFASGALEWVLLLLQQLAVPPLFSRVPKSVKTKEEREEDLKRAAEKKAKAAEEARRLEEEAAEQEAQKKAAEEAAKAESRAASASGRKSKEPSSRGGSRNKAQQPDEDGSPAADGSSPSKSGARSTGSSKKSEKKAGSRPGTNASSAKSKGTQEPGGGDAESSEAAPGGAAIYPPPGSAGQRSVAGQSNDPMMDFVCNKTSGGGSSNSQENQEDGTTRSSAIGGSSYRGTPPRSAASSKSRVIVATPGGDQDADLAPDQHPPRSAASTSSPSSKGSLRAVAAARAGEEDELALHVPGAGDFGAPVEVAVVEQEAGVDDQTPATLLTSSPGNKRRESTVASSKAGSKASPPPRRGSTSKGAGKGGETKAQKANGKSGNAKN
ncbi:unnamed protein product [Amoebophrya sp. A25]|nr:unnamed protein product [Amoebophrya sp. A25]|eukprot:GSA25T00007043001.1